MLTLKTLIPKLKVLFVALTLIISGIAFGHDEESALEMVRTLRLGRNFSDMSYELSKVTTTYQGIGANVGFIKADEMLRLELALAVSKYQKQWDINLAKAWAPLMTPSELVSVATDKQKSPYAAKFLSLQNQAGATMKAESKSLLITVTTEALSKAFAKSIGQK